MKKIGRNSQPNAPDLQQILLDSPTVRQPPRNPYYSDLDAGSNSPPNFAPPPYPSIVVPGTSVAQPVPGSFVNYPRQSRNEISMNPSIIVQHSVYDRRADQVSRKVKKFNVEVFYCALCVIGLSLYSHSLFAKRVCLDYIVQRPVKDITIYFHSVREMQLYVAYGSAFIVALSILKCSSNQSRSHSCYIFLMSVSIFIMTCFTGYLSYLTFYSPCSTELSQIASGLAKTMIGSIMDQMPASGPGSVAESNIFNYANSDREGIWVFFINLLNFTIYIASFFACSLLG